MATVAPSTGRGSSVLIRRCSASGRTAGSHHRLPVTQRREKQVSGMKMLKQLFAAGVVVGGLGSAAQAVVILNDDFEYADQAAFEGTWMPIGTTAPISAELSTAQ